MTPLPRHAVRAFQFIAVPLACLALWEILCRSGAVRAQLLPPASQVFRKAWQALLPAQPFDPNASSYLRWFFSGELISDSLSSLYRVLVGFIIGAGLALPLGLLMGAYRTVN